MIGLQSGTNKGASQVTVSRTVSFIIACRNVCRRATVAWATPGTCRNLLSMLDNKIDTLFYKALNNAKSYGQWRRVDIIDNRYVHGGRLICNHYIVYLQGRIPQKTGAVNRDPR